MAGCFVTELKKQFGDVVYMDAINWWDFYGPETCYWPKIKDKYISIEYCRREWFLEKGYRGIEYYDAVPNFNDLGEFETTSCDISSLFEIGV